MPRFLRVDLDIFINGEWTVLNTDWSTDAVFVSFQRKYAWDLRWEQMGVKWILLVDAACRTDIGFGLLWTYRLDQFSAYGSADFRAWIQHPEVWDVAVPTFHGPAWLDVTIFGPHIGAIGAAKLTMRRWSEMP